MSESCITKKVLAYSIKTLMRERPLSKITVGDICEACDMNRKSFYYHFRDKFDLVNWIFTTDFREACSRERGADGDRMLLLCRFLRTNRDFYRAALQQQGQNSFYEHLGESLRPMVSERLENAGIRLDTGNLMLQLMTCYYRDAIARWVLDGCTAEPELFVRSLYDAAEMLGRTAAVPAVHAEPVADFRGRRAAGD